MILEGLITTTNADGTPHLAPMGPAVDGPAFTSFLLRPFNTSQTYRNLKAHDEGVLHITDDVLLLAKAAVGGVTDFPASVPATTVQGSILKDACRAFEFRVTQVDDHEERVCIECEVVRTHSLRDWFGFNRARHAVLEAAILATRFHLLPAEDIESQFRHLRVIVNKTAGPSEFQAMAFLESKWREHRGVS
ncbi:DUF447 family protein [soil metagenome]